MRLQTIRYAILLLSIGFSPRAVSNPLIAHTKKAIVTIARQTTVSAYETAPSCSARGCLLDKAQGYILTTKQAIGVAVVGDYNVTFHDGSQAKAKVLYTDPWLDYGFLQVDPTQIPTDARAIPCSTQEPSLYQPVWVIGNAQNDTFSVHTGRITNLYTITGPMPGHTMGISLDTRGGTLGSPVLNEKGEIIALYCAGGVTCGTALHPAYIRYAWQAIAQGQTPSRKQIGVLTELYALPEAIRYRNFPKDQLKAYSQQFPGALCQAIQVQGTLPGWPAADVLLPGDLIWAIQGQPVGPSLVAFDHILNTSTAARVQLTIYRAGQCKEVEVALCDLEAHTIQRLVCFGGVTFFETDPYMSQVQNIPAHTVTFCQTYTDQTIFNRVPYQRNTFALHVVAMDQTPIHTLDDLIQHIPALIKKKYFTLAYSNKLPYLYNDSLNSLVSAVRTGGQADITYDEHMPDPELFTFDQTTKTWQAEKIVPLTH